MDIFKIIICIAGSLYLIGIFCVKSFNLFIFKSGIAISNKIIDIKDGQRTSFENRIGMTFEKDDAIIKVISNSMLFFIPNPRPLEWRIMCYFPSILFIDDGKYEIVSLIPITLLAFPLSLREPLKTSVFRGICAMLHCKPLQLKRIQCNSVAPRKPNRVFRGALNSIVDTWIY